MDFLRKALAVGVFAVAVLPYARSSGYGIIWCDDSDYTRFHSEIHGGLTSDGVRWAFADVSEAIWMPLVWMSYMVDFDVATFQQMEVEHVMHLHSVLLHGVNAVLLWVLLCLVCHVRGAPPRQSKRDMWICAAGALMWAVHPLRVESVVWIASRKDVLSMAWLLGALIFWVKWRIGNGERGTGNGEWGMGNGERGTGGRSAFYALSILCFAVGAMAKPSVMCFPVLCLLLDWTMGRGVCDAVRARRWTVLWAYVAPCALAAAVAGEAAWAQSAGGATAPMAGVPLSWKLVNAATSYGLYLWHTLVPEGLAVQCLARYPGLPRLWWIGIPVCAAAVWWMAGSARRLWRGGLGRGEASVLAGFAWFTVSVAPMLGIAGFGAHALADRFTYIPAVGLSLALVGLWKGGKAPDGGLGMGDGNFSSTSISKLSSILAVAAIAVLAALTWRQTGFWRNELVLWSHTLDVDTPTNEQALSAVGRWYFEFDHDPEKCDAFFSRQRESSEDRYLLFANVHALALFELGKHEEIVRLMPKYSRWADTHPVPGRLYRHILRALYFAGDGHFDAAEEEFVAADAIARKNVLLLYARGLVRARRARPGDEAAAREFLYRARSEGELELFTHCRFLWKEQAICDILCGQMTKGMKEARHEICNQPADGDRKR